MTKVAAKHGKTYEGSWSLKLINLWIWVKSYYYHIQPNKYTYSYKCYNNGLKFHSLKTYALVRICLLMAAKGLTSWLSFVMSYCGDWYPGSGVVLDCIDSWSLPSFFLWWMSRPDQLASGSTLFSILKISIASKKLGWIWYKEIMSADPPISN